jgi:hypothetical protein
MFLQRLNYNFWKQRDTIFFTLAVPHRYLFVAKVEVLYPVR